MKLYSNESCPHRCPPMSAASAWSDHPATAFRGLMDARTSLAPIMQSCLKHACRSPNQTMCTFTTATRLFVFAFTKGRCLYNALLAWPRSFNALTSTCYTTSRLPCAIIPILDVLLSQTVLRNAPKVSSMLGRLYLRNVTCLFAMRSVQVNSVLRHLSDSTSSS